MTGTDAVIFVAVYLLTIAAGCALICVCVSKLGPFKGLAVSGAITAVFLAVMIAIYMVQQ